MRIRAVLFDADGVIQRPKQGRGPAWLNLLGRSEDLDAFLADIFTAELPCLHGPTDFRPGFAEVLTRWQCRGTLTYALDAWTMVEMDQNIAGTIDMLRSSGVMCCLATNQEAIRADYMSRMLGYSQLFDREFYSCHMGVAKPNIAYFQRIVEDLAIPAQNILFFDDRQDNVDAALAAGLHAVRFILADGESRLVRILNEFDLAVKRCDDSERA